MIIFSSIRRAAVVAGCAGALSLGLLGAVGSAQAQTSVGTPSVSARPIAPHATGKFHADRGKAGVTAAPDAVVAYSQLQNVSNGDCLNGTLALVYMTPCNSSDAHMTWGAAEYDVDGYLAYTLQNHENGECLNGYTGSAHAEVTLTPCSSSDNHMLWYPLGNGSGIDEYENVSNGDCLNGYTGSAHAEVTVTPCNSSDSHMSWYNGFPY